MLSLQLLHSPLALSLSYAITPSQLQNTCTLLTCSHSNCCTHHLHCPYLMQSLQASFRTHAHSFQVYGPSSVLLPCALSKPASYHMHTPSMLSLQLLHSPLALSLSYAITPSQPSLSLLNAYAFSPSSLLNFTRCVRER